MATFLMQNLKARRKTARGFLFCHFFTLCVCTQVYIHMHVYGGQRTTLRTQYYKATVETSRNRTQVTKPKHKQFYLLSHFADLTFLLLLTFNFLISIQNTGLPYVSCLSFSRSMCMELKRKINRIHVVLNFVTPSIQLIP